MSQYPISYYPQPQQRDPRKPAKWAGLVMIVLGSLAFLFAGCMGLVGAMFASLQSQMPPQAMADMQKLEADMGVPIRMLMFVTAGLFAAYALIFIVLGVVTRSGRMGAVVTSIVLTSGVIIYFVINSLVLVGGGQAIGATTLSVLLMIAHVVLLVLLIQAARSASAVKLLGQQQTVQMAQYQQMQQQYYQQGQQQGYGYGQQSQPPRQPPPPPPE